MHNFTHKMHPRRILQQQNKKKKIDKRWHLTFYSNDNEIYKDLWTLRVETWSFRSHTLLTWSINCSNQQAIFVVEMILNKWRFCGFYTNKVIERLHKAAGAKVSLNLTAILNRLLGRTLAVRPISFNKVAHSCNEINHQKWEIKPVMMWVKITASRSP